MECFDHCEVEPPEGAGVLVKVQCGWGAILKFEDCTALHDITVRTCCYAYHYPRWTHI